MSYSFLLYQRVIPNNIKLPTGRPPAISDGHKVLMTFVNNVHNLCFVGVFVV